MDRQRRPGLYIGTSGWVYPHWRNIFYPQGLAQRSWLAYYAQNFNACEINGSFYRLPSRTSVENWLNTVGPDFRFCIKLSRFVTHAKKLNDPGLTLPRFFDVFGIAVDRLGPILIQLPANLAFQKEKVKSFFEYLSKNYRGFSFSLEARHAGWQEPAAIDLLRSYKIGWVIADSGTRFASADLITADHIYLRFHGPDGSYATSYDKRMLKSCAEKCRRWLHKGHSVWIFFNNDIHGHAIRNAQMLRELTGAIKSG